MGTPTETVLYVILTDDKTTAAGTVQAKATAMQWTNVHVAHEKDDVVCQPSIRLDRQVSAATTCSPRNEPSTVTSRHFRA